MKASLDPERLPRHIAVIMDGNGRWAKRRGLTRVAGHREGAKAVREVVEASRELGIQVLTLYAFSTENWNRPPREINTLMRLLAKFLRQELASLIKNNIALRAIGNLERLPEEVKREIRKVMELTRNHTGMILNLALSYGGREEILRAVKKLAEGARDGRWKAEEINATLLESHLDTGGLPDPDLLIRTSGEHRISNFLLWQMAYTELYFCDILWPDFRKKDLLQAILNYQERERRFGLTQEQIQNTKWTSHILKDGSPPSS
jgi:undecaprenyl diphosphate synthase